MASLALGRVNNRESKLPALRPDVGIKQLSPSADAVITTASSPRDPSPVGSSPFLLTPGSRPFHGSSDPSVQRSRNRREPSPFNTPEGFSPFSPLSYSDSLVPLPPRETKLGHSPRSLSPFQIPDDSKFPGSPKTLSKSPRPNTEQATSLPLFGGWNPLLADTSPLGAPSRDTSNHELANYDAWVDTWFGGMETNETPKTLSPRPSGPLSPKERSMESQRMLASWSGVEFRPSTSAPTTLIAPELQRGNSYTEDRSRPRTRAHHTASQPPPIPAPYTGVNPTRQRAATADAIPQISFVPYGTVYQSRQRSSTLDPGTEPNWNAVSGKKNSRRVADLSASPIRQPLSPSSSQGSLYPSSPPSSRGPNYSTPPRQGRSKSPSGAGEPRYRRKSKGRSHGSFHGNRKEADASRFELDIGRVIAGDEIRTTLMVKNIPNKYSQEMLLEAVDERHKGCYDFFYLPIDFKNKCNVGYAFINFISPRSIISFHAEFNQKKWGKFNSSKVCKITYARIQGKLAFIEHFRNSSLMHEDPKCRPLIFFSNGPQQGLPEPFPIPSTPFVRNDAEGFDFVSAQAGYFDDDSFEDDQ